MFRILKKYIIKKGLLEQKKNPQFFFASQNLEFWSLSQEFNARKGPLMSLV